jgi:hypothetical protein
MSSPIIFRDPLSGGRDRSVLLGKVSVMADETAEFHTSAVSSLGHSAFYGDQMAWQPRLGPLMKIVALQDRLSRVIEGRRLYRNQRRTARYWLWVVWTEADIARFRQVARWHGGSVALFDARDVLKNSRNQSL